jgi:proline dehydrogenase
MEEYNISPLDDSVYFGQLYGMCDFITFYLGGIGYSAYKYVPYGPVEEVLPYLGRRAVENGKGVLEKIEKEKRLIKTEIKRRLFNA